MRIKTILILLIFLVLVLSLLFSLKWFRTQKKDGPGNLSSATAEIVEVQENNAFVIKVIQDNSFNNGDLIVLHTNSNIYELKNETQIVTTVKRGDLIRFTYDGYQKNDDNQIIIFSDDIIKYGNTSNGTNG